MGKRMNKGGMKKATMDGGPVSPRKAMAGANVKGGKAKIDRYANGGCVTRVGGGSRVVGRG